MLGAASIGSAAEGAFGRGALDYLAGTQAGRSFYGPAAPAPPAGRPGGAPAASGLGARGEGRAGAASPPPPQSGTPSSTSASSGVPDWTVDWGPRGPPPGKAAASPEPLLGPAGVRVPDLLQGAAWALLQFAVRASGVFPEGEQRGRVRRASGEGGRSSRRPG